MANSLPATCSFNELAIEGFGDASLVMIVGTEEMVTLNETAARMVVLLQEEFGEDEFGLEDATERLSAEFGLDADRAATEAREMIEDWAAHGLVVCRGAE